MAVFKTKDESEGAFIVRVLKDAHERAIEAEYVARTKKEAAFEALTLAEQALKIAQDDNARRMA